MTAIWQNDGATWKLLSASGFPDEAALHSLVERAPHILPLAGKPDLTVVGREVLLGGNWADLIAIESSGRLAIIEIKLSRNAEARRAVVAQILAYAAYLHGVEPAVLQNTILATHLRERGFSDLAAAGSDQDQSDGFELDVFNQGLQESLSEGRFRLVLVLDDAPPELVRLVGYLETVTDKLLIDLIVVTSYFVGETQLIVPQRVDPERQVERQSPSIKREGDDGQFFAGADAFIESIAEAVPEQRPQLRRLADWAKSLESEGLVSLGSYRGKSGRWTLLPRIPAEHAGLVTIWNDKGPALSFWRSVFERRAPATLAKIEGSPEAPKIGKGTYTREIPDSLLVQLTDAYREAAGGSLDLDG